MGKNDITHVILGICMQTVRMTEILEEAGAVNIAVIDYEAEEGDIQVASIHFYSPGVAQRKLKKSKQVVFHKYLIRRK